MKKVGAIGCELCGSPANTYCESDQARLCWNCDDKVHGANFLVAKHTRTLLCHLCQSPTSWSASGPKLTPSMSFCLSCLNRNKISSSLSTTSLQPPQDGHVSYEDHDHHLEDGSDDIDSDEDIDDSIESDDDDEEDDDHRSYSEDDDDDDDDENQVVPWTSTPVESTTARGSTSSEAEELLFSPSSLKRKREISY